MNSVWRSLLWKEWREHRWIPSLIIAGCVAIGLLNAAIYQDWEMFIIGPIIVLALGVPATAMFVGAGIAARERSQRTLGFMQALPASMKKAAGAKIVVASATVMAPSLLACLVLAALYVLNAFDSSNDPFQYDLLTMGFAALVSGAAAVSLLTWTAAAGVNQVDELRAGAIGLLVIACVWAVFVLLGNLFSTTANGDWPTWLSVAGGGAPGGIFALMPLGGNLSGPGWVSRRVLDCLPLLAICVPIHAALAAWYVARLGRGAKPQAVREALVAVQPARQWLNPPRRSCAGAIVWKQFRESAPLAAMGGLAILIISPIVARAGSGDALLPDFIETWQLTAISTWLMAGVFVSVVGGIGLFYDDLRPGLHTFWRSRPINVDAWFWTKLATGLAVTVGVLAAGPLLTLAAHWLTGQTHFARLPQEPPLVGVIGAGLLLHAATFILAALAIVLVRQPVLAAMLTIGAWIVIAVSTVMWFDDAPQRPVTDLAFLGISAVGGVAIIAWQALRRDWGWGGAS
jgi:hypothetical protein